MKNRELIEFLKTQNLDADILVAIFRTRRPCLLIDVDSVCMNGDAIQINVDGE